MPSANSVYDVVVVGLGTAGSATCMELARRGCSVAGFDTGSPPHTSGSHHGRTRSVRRAYMEGTAYVPMALRAWDLWQKLEQDTGVELLLPTGNLTLGVAGSAAVLGVEQSARAYDLPFELLGAREIHDRWPALEPPRDFVGVLETEAGIVFPDRAIAAMLERAATMGAELHLNARVHGWRETETGVEVSTADGTYAARSLVIAAGARVNALLSVHTDAPLVTPRRVPVCWFAPPSAAAFSYGTYPVNFWQIPDDELGSSASAGSVGRADPATPSEPWEVYSLPVTDGVPGVKVAAHNRLRPCDPDSDPQMVSPEEIDLLRGFVERYIPELRGAEVETERCFYATTSDGEFRLGHVPRTSAVFAGAFAGHGFKFAPVLGEILADLATGRTPGFDLSLFTWGE